MDPVVPGPEGRPDLGGVEDLVQGVIDLLHANQVRDDAHVRVVAYFDEVEPGREADAEAGAFILAFPRPSSPKLMTGVRVTLSPWRRLNDNAMSPRVKGFVQPQSWFVDLRLPAIQ